MSELKFEATLTNSDFIRKVEQMRKSIGEVAAETEKMEKKMDAAMQKCGAFDSEVLKMCNHLDQYFNGLLNKLNAMSMLLQGGTSNLKGTAVEPGDSSRQLDELNAKNAELTEQIRLQKEEIVKQQTEWQNLAAMVQGNNTLINEEYQERTSICTLIANARQELIGMSEAGLQNTAQYRQSADELAAMYSQMTQINAEMDYLAGSGNGFKVMKTSLSEVASAASLTTGILGLFNRESEMMTEIQAKVQSVLGIIVDLENVYGGVKKSNIVLLTIENIQRKALFAAETLGSKAKTANIALTWGEVAAQKAFNLVANANPYVLLATAILTVVGGIALLIDANKNSSKEQEEMNKKLAISKEIQEKYTGKIASNAAEPIAAYQKLRTEYDALGNNMQAKKKFVTDNQDAFRQLGMSVNGVSAAENVFVTQSGAVINAMMARAKAAAAQSMAEDSYKKMMQSSEDYEQKLQGYKSQEQMARELAKKQGFDYNSLDALGKRNMMEGVRKDYNAQNADIAASKKSRDMQQQVGDSYTRASVSYEQASQKEFQKAKIKTSSAGSIGNTGNTSKAEQDRKIEELEQRQREVKLKNEEELAKRLKDMYNDTEQAKVDEKRDGNEKVLAQMTLNHKKELDALKKEEEDYRQQKLDAAKEDFELEEKIATERNPTREKKTFDASTAALTESEIAAFNAKNQAVLAKQAAETEAYNDREKQAMYENLKEYGTYIQKREAIIALGEFEKKGKSPTEQKKINNKTNEVVALLDIEAGKKTSTFGKLFSDMKGRTVADMRAIVTEAQKAMEYVKTGKYEADGNGKGKYGISKESFEHYQKNPEQLEDQVKGSIESVTEAADTSENALTRMEIGFKKAFEAGSDTEKLQVGLALIESGLNEAMQAGQFLANSLSGLSDAFGSETLGAIADGIGVAMDAAGAAMEGAKAGAMFGPIGSAAGAAIGMVSSLASSFAKMHDAKSEKRIQQMQEQIDVLTDSYDDLDEAVDRAYSSDASQLIDQQNTLLTQQKVLIRNQIAEEQNKKKSDAGRIKEWEDQIKEIDKAIAGNKEKQIDVIFGEDVKAAIDNFAQAYADAWSAGDDRAKSSKDLVKNMIKQMVMESIKAASSDPMKALREKLADFYKDGVISDWERGEIEKEAEALTQKLDDKFGWADQYMKGDEEGTSQNSTKGGFEAMSQETGSELNGRFTAIQVANEEIRNSMLCIVGNLTSMSASVANGNITLIEMRNLAVMSNSYLHDIAGNTKRIMIDFGSKLDNIERSSKIMAGN